MKKKIPYQVPKTAIHFLSPASPLAESYNELTGAWVTGSGYEDYADFTVEP